MQKFNSYWTLYQLISSIAPAFALWKGWSWNIKIKLRVGAGSVVRSLFVRFAAMCCCLSKSIGHHGYVIWRGLTGQIFSFISQLQVAIRLQQHHYTPFADRTWFWWLTNLLNSSGIFMNFPNLWPQSQWPLICFHLRNKKIFQVVTSCTRLFKLRERDVWCLSLGGNRTFQQVLHFLSFVSLLHRFVQF